MLIPAGATVRGRIVKMQHWTVLGRFDVAIQLESWEMGPVRQALYAEPERQGTMVDLKTHRQGELINLPPTAGQMRVWKQIIHTPDSRYVMPRGFATRWRTVGAPAPR